MLTAIMKLTPAIKPTAIVMQNNNNKIDSYSNDDDDNKSSSRYEDTDTAAENSYSRIHRRASADDRINVSFPEEFGTISKERGRYRKAMEAGKEPRKGSFASVVMIAAIAVLIVLNRA